MVGHSFAVGVHARVRERFARHFGIDVRALAAFRVALGALLLADLALRSRHLVAFYTDAGVLPRTVLVERFPAISSFSVHAVSGAASVQVGLFLLAGGFAVALLVGYRTTAATVGSLVLLVSLHARNPLVLNGGDAMLRRFLLWGAFLPLGERWSVDARRADDSPRARVANLASAALLCQVVFVYTTNAALKFRGDLWVRGEAIRYVLSLDQFTVLLGDALARHPDVLRALTWSWLALIASSVLLVLLTGRARAALASLFVAMHLGMALTMGIGLFPAIAIAGLLPFLPRSIWDAAGGRSAGARRLAGHAAAWPASWTPAQWTARRERIGRIRRAVRRRGPFDRAGSVTTSALPALRRTKRRLGPPVVAALLALALAWNAAALDYVDPPDRVESTVDPDDRRWDMFAPEPMQADGWYVAPGRLESGERIDAFRLRPVRWDRPPDVARTYPTARWRKYLVGIRHGDDDLHGHFAGYLCRRWNDGRDDGLVEVDVAYVEQPTRFDGSAPTETVDHGRYSC